MNTGVTFLEELEKNSSVIEALDKIEEKFAVRLSAPEIIFYILNGTPTYMHSAVDGITLEELIASEKYIIQYCEKQLETYGNFEPYELAILNIFQRDESYPTKHFTKVNNLKRLIEETELYEFYRGRAAFLVQPLVNETIEASAIEYSIYKWLIEEKFDKSTEGNKASYLNSIYLGKKGFIYCLLSKNKDLKNGVQVLHNKIIMSEDFLNFTTFYEDIMNYNGEDLLKLIKAGYSVGEVYEVVLTITSFYGEFDTVKVHFDGGELLKLHSPAMPIEWTLQLHREKLFNISMGE